MPQGGMSVRKALGRGLVQEEVRNLLSMEVTCWCLPASRYVMLPATSVMLEGCPGKAVAFGERQL